MNNATPPVNHHIPMLVIILVYLITWVDAYSHISNSHSTSASRSISTSKLPCQIASTLNHGALSCNTQEDIKALNSYQQAAFAEKFCDTTQSPLFEGNRSLMKLYYNSTEDVAWTYLYSATWNILSEKCRSRRGMLNRILGAETLKQINDLCKPKVNIKVPPVTNSALGTSGKGGLIEKNCIIYEYRPMYINVLG